MAETVPSFIKFHGKIISKTHSWTAFELLSITLVSTLLVWSVQYMWSRRKLYKYSNRMQGPFAFPLIGCALYFIGSPYDIFSNIMMMFNKYPKIFRVWFGPRLFYAVSDPKYFEILLPNCLRKEHLYYHAECVVGHGLFTAPVNTWKRHKKIIMPTFNQKILDSFVEVFSQQANVLVEQLKKHADNEEFDVCHVVSSCTVNIICETAMGVKINAQTTDCPYSRWVDRIMEIVFLRIFVFWYHFDSIFYRTPLGRETSDLVKKLHKFSGDIVREKKRAYEEKMRQLNECPDISFEEEPRRKAFLDYLIELTSDENSKFTEQELREEVDTFIIAGSDTTASANSFVLIMLGLHQDLQQRVYQEVIEVLGPERSVEPADLPKLKYMELFIKETLRLFPMGPIIVRSVDEDVDLGDHMIPAGTSVVFGILSAHTNEEYWPDPYKFDPDRFLPEQVVKRHPCAYVPFSYGPRSCIGTKYAMMAMKSVLATIVRKYKISTSYKHVMDVKLKANLVLRPKDGYRISVKLR